MKTKKTEIPFNAEMLVARVEGFAAGRERTHERTVKLPPPVKAIPAKEIRAIRTLLGCTQTEFAALLNVPKVTAISWENGTRKHCRRLEIAESYCCQQALGVFFTRQI